MKLELKNNQMTKLKSSEIVAVGTDFCFHNKILTDINLPSVETIGNYFCTHNESLTSIELVKLSLCVQK